MVGKGRNDGDFCEVISPRPQIALGFRLCEAVARSLFPQRLGSEMANELQHNRDLSFMLPRMKTAKRVTWRISPRAHLLLAIKTWVVVNFGSYTSLAG